MNFTVEIVSVNPPGPESDQGMPSVRLPNKYHTPEEAGDAAAAYLKELERPVGAAFYRILDDEGHEVASLEHRQRTAS